MNVFVEALMVGVIVVVVGTIVGFVVGKSMAVDLPPVCKAWNKNFIMEICLFLTGVIVQLGCEWTGINKWYCKNGNACKK